MTQAVTYERETKSVTFQGKIIVLESLTSGHIDPKWRKLKGRHLLGAVF